MRLAWFAFATVGLAACPGPTPAPPDSRPPLDHPLADARPTGEAPPGRDALAEGSPPTLCMAASPFEAGGSTNLVDAKGVVCAVCPAGILGRSFVPALWGVVDCVASCGSCTQLEPPGPSECTVYPVVVTSSCTLGGEPAVSISTGMTCALCAQATDGASVSVSSCVAPAPTGASGPVYCVPSCTSGCEGASAFGA